MKKIKVFLVDDHELVRKMIAKIIDTFSNTEVIGEAENGEDALNKLNQTSTFPDLILMDINMPVMNGIEATQIIRKKYPEIKILALTLLSESNAVKNMFDAGAAGYLLKKTSPEELQQAITAIFKSKLESNQDESSINTTKQQPIKDDYLQLIVEDFNKKQKEILLFKSRAYQDEQIQRKLLLQPATYNKLLNDILSKLKVSEINLETYIEKHNITSYLDL